VLKCVKNWLKPMLRLVTIKGDLDVGNYVVMAGLVYYLSY